MKHIKMSFRACRGISLLCILLLSGCRYSFDLQDSGLEPRICIMSYINEGEEGTIDIYKTVPVYETGNADMSLITPSFSLKCNGNEIDAEYEMIGDEGLRISHPEFRSGDLLELTASANGLETVYASTTVPEAFPKFTQQFRFDEDNNRSILISYEEGQGKNYYGAVVEYRVPWKVNPNTYSIGFCSPIQGYDELSLDKNAYSPVVTYIKDRYIFVWNEEADGEYEIKFSLDYLTQTQKQFRLHLYRLSEEMYRKLNAEYDADSNPFAYLGMSSPSFTYTNIRNGVGHFCACSVTVSDWMTE